MKKTITSLVAMAVIMVVLQSCATLFTGTKDKIKFDSEPSGATVELFGTNVGTTPCEVRVRRQLAPPTVTIKKEGYASKSFQLSNKFNAVSVLNILNLVAWAIDVATGSIKKYDTNSYHVKLDKK